MAHWVRKDLLEEEADEEIRKVSSAEVEHLIHYGRGHPVTELRVVQKTPCMMVFRQLQLEMLQLFLAKQLKRIPFGPYLYSNT